MLTIEFSLVLGNKTSKKELLYFMFLIYKDYNNDNINANLDLGNT